MPTLTLDPTTKDFSARNALFLANASDIAYLESVSDAARELLGFSKAVTFNHRPSDTQGFVGVLNGSAVLAFRGSEKVRLGKVQDWLTDITVDQIERKPYAGKVHRGFCDALTDAWG